jgi:pSer/pThr/pTyr-binding forkhead associated (FHA) protein
MADENYTLLMQLGPKQGETVAVLGEEFVMGRDASCEWPIEDIEVSRRHARLILEKGVYSIEDLGSTNGTFVNGQRIRSVLPLLPGATIRLGENVLLFYDSASTGDDSTKTMRVEKVEEPAEPESVKASNEAKQVAEPEAIDPPAQVDKDAPKEIEESPPAIQEMKSAPSPRRERMTSLPVFGKEIRLGVVVIAVIGALAMIAFLWYVDANFLWCDVFGNLIAACR